MSGNKLAPDGSISRRGAIAGAAGLAVTAALGSMPVFGRDRAQEGHPTKAAQAHSQTTNDHVTE